MKSGVIRLPVAMPGLGAEVGTPVKLPVGLAIGCSNAETGRFSIIVLVLNPEVVIGCIELLEVDAASVILSR